MPSLSFALLEQNKGKTIRSAEKGDTMHAKSPPNNEDLEYKLDAIDKKLDQHAWLALMIFGGGWAIGAVGAATPDLWHITKLGLVSFTLGLALLIIGAFGYKREGGKKTMFITRHYACLCIILVVVAALVLALGQYVGFSDVVRAGISGFIFALIASLMVFGYEDAKDERERKENIKLALEAIRGELELNLQNLGLPLANTDVKEVRLAPDRLIKVSYSGISNAGFLSLLTPQQQQIISSIYHKFSRVEMFSDYGVLFAASQSIESPYIFQQIPILENELRKEIPECIVKINDWLKEPAKDKKTRK